MNDRRLRFIAEFGIDQNAAAAARRAGYSPRSAKVTACRLLTDANVREALRTSQRETARKLELDREKVLAGLVEAVDVARAQGDPGAMIRAWAEIGKLLGYYAPERAVKVHVSVAAKRTVAALETLPDSALTALVTEAGATT